MTQRKALLKVWLVQSFVIICYSYPFRNIEPQYGTKHYDEPKLLTRKGPFDNNGRLSPGYLSRKTSILNNPDARFKDFYLAHRQEHNDDDDYSADELVDKDMTVYVNMEEVKNDLDPYERKASVEKDYTPLSISKAPLEKTDRSDNNGPPFTPWTNKPFNGFHKTSYSSAPISDIKRKFMRPYKTYNSFGKADVEVYRKDDDNTNKRSENVNEQKVKNFATESRVINEKLRKENFVNEKKNMFKQWGGKRTSMPITWPVRKFLNDSWKSLVFAYSREFDDPNYVVKVIQN